MRTFRRWPLEEFSDHADSNKNELEELMQGKARLVASVNAATFLKEQLRNPEFLAVLRSERQLRAGAPIPGLLPVVEEESTVTRAIRAVGSEIDLKLKELCPEFSLTQKGYHLPSPRIRPIRLRDDPRDQQNNVVDILEAIESNRVRHRRCASQLSRSCVTLDLG